MQFLQDAYSDDVATDTAVTTLPALASASTAAAATPAVDVAPSIAALQSPALFADPHSVKVNVNIKADALWAPVAGAKHPLHRDLLVPGQKNTLTGFVENHNMNNFQFAQEYASFRNKGFAADPDKRGTVMAKHVPTPHEKTKKRDRGQLDGEYWGSWSRPDELDFNQDIGVDMSTMVTDEEAAEIDERKAQENVDAIAKHQASETVQQQALYTNERTVFHGKKLTDYQGRTYIWPPSDLKPTEHDCFIPKKHIHTWTGHTKEVNCIRFFPDYGHLLLSASADNTIKIWDASSHRRCLRTMYGHSKAVRDVCFSSDGKKFLSAGYDKVVRLWDTETGQCLDRYQNGPMAFQARLKPNDDNFFLTGCSDKRIYQWDVRSGKTCQSYHEHLGAINTVTFIDHNRRFVSTSDDKKIFVWEFGIPVVVKHVSDPSMHAVPATAVHPSGEYMACQNLDNTVTVYECTSRFRMRPQKKFKGHVCAGYAVQLAFSPDGRFLVSGDANGRTFFYDWKSTKNYRTLKSHDGVCMSVDWHPITPSHVATGGWDGTIKLFD